MVGTKDKLQYWEGKPVLYSDIDEPQRQEESRDSNTPGFLNKALKAPVNQFICLEDLNFNKQSNWF